ncbi:MAG: hypothetical protein WBZ40_05370 [Acidimicrobiia bacterium]
MRIRNPWARKSGRRALLVGLVAVALMATALPASAAITPFTGAWTGPDGDGSTQYLFVGFRSNAVYYDDGGTICDINFGEMSPAVAAGRATVSGNTLTFTATGYCLLSTGPASFGSADFVFTLDPGSSPRRFDDTITESTGGGFGCTYTHLGGGGGFCP